MNNSFLGDYFAFEWKLPDPTCIVSLTMPVVNLLLLTDTMAIDNTNVYFLEIDRIQFEVFEKINEIASLSKTSLDQSESIDERRASLAQIANSFISKIPGLLDVIEVQIRQENPKLIEKSFIQEKVELYREKVSYLKLKLKESQLIAYSLESELTHKKRLEEYVKEEEDSSDMREELLAGRSQVQATDSEKPINEQILSQNKNITSTLKLTKQLMTMSVMQTELNIDGLDQQSKDLNKLNDKLVDLQGVLMKSKEIVKFIEKQDKRDRRRIYFSIGFLLVCCAWVLWRRVLKMPVKILIWSLLKFFGAVNWVVYKYPSDTLGIQVTANENLEITTLSSSYVNSFETDFTTLIDDIEEQESQFTILPIFDEVGEEMQFSILPIDVEVEEEMRFSILPIDVATDIELTESVLESIETLEASELENIEPLEEIKEYEETETEAQEFQPNELGEQVEDAQVDDENPVESDTVTDDSSVEDERMEESVEKDKDVPMEFAESPEAVESPNYEPEFEKKEQAEENASVNENKEALHIEYPVDISEEEDRQSEFTEETGVSEEDVEKLQDIEATGIESQINDEAVEEAISDGPNGEYVEEVVEEPLELVSEPTETVDDPIEIESEEPFLQEEEPFLQEEEPILQEEESILQEEEPILHEQEPILKREPHISKKEYSIEESGAPSMQELIEERKDEITKASQSGTYNSMLDELLDQEMGSHSEYIQNVRENQSAHTWDAKDTI